MDHSLKKAQDRIQHTLNYEWGEMLVTGWNKAGWMDQPNKVGDRIAKLIGATSKTVTVGDTLSIKVFQALASATPIIKIIGKFYSLTQQFPFRYLRSARSSKYATGRSPS